MDFEKEIYGISKTCYGCLKNLTSLQIFKIDAWFRFSANSGARRQNGPFPL